MKVIWNSLMNFIQRSVEKEEPSHDIVAIASDFYKKQAILSARNRLGEIYSETSLKGQTKEELLMELINSYSRFIETCTENYVFAIFEPDEVPQINLKSRADLSRRLQKIEKKLEDTLSLRFDTPLNSPTRQAQPEDRLVDSAKDRPILWSVVVSNPPKVSDPKQKKVILDECDIGNKVVGIKSTNQQWVVKLSDREAAMKVASHFQSRDSQAKVKVPVLLGVSKGIPKCVPLETIRDAIPGCSKATRINDSSTVKLYFESDCSLEMAIKNGLKIEYDIYRVCYNCQKFNHVAAECPNPPKCSRCSDDHRSSRENPCSRETKCANCGSSQHPAYSLSCPAIHLVKNPTSTQPTHTGRGPETERNRPVQLSLC